MRLCLFALAIACTILSCTPTKTYVYSASMKKPAISDRLFYENDTMTISFRLNTKTIGFTIENKTEDGIKIDWDEVSLSLGAKTYRVVHSETGAAKVREVQPPSTIPPHATLKDFIVPAGNVYFDRDFFTNVQVVKLKELFPTTDNASKARKDYILSRKGKSVIIFMPFYMRGQYVSKYYEIVIDDVTEKKKKK